MKKRIHPKSGWAAAWLALLLIGCKPGEPGTAGKAPERPAAPVRVAVSVKADVPIALESIATAKAFKIVTIKPQVAGTAAKKFFTAGQFVHEGDPLYQLDARPFEAALAQAEATLAKDRALAANARREAIKKKELLRDGAASEQEYDAAEAQALALEATVAGDEAAVKEAKLRLEYCSIAAPADGFLGPTLTDAGNVVKANETELVVLRQVKPIYVELAVPQRHLGAIREAMGRGEVALNVTLPNDAGPVECGKLLFMNNTVDEETGTIKLRGLFENPATRLWPGQFLRASLVLGVEKGAVLIPAVAVQNGQKGSYVFIVKEAEGNKVVEPRPVTLGRPHGERIVVASGLEAGETVVTEGQLRLVPGAKVRVLEEKPAAGDGKDAR